MNLEEMSSKGVAEGLVVETNEVGLTLDNVRFGPEARWQVSNANVAIGPGDITPALPGVNAPHAAYPGPACTRRWMPFPDDPDRPSPDDTD